MNVASSQLPSEKELTAPHSLPMPPVEIPARFPQPPSTVPIGRSILFIFFLAALIVGALYAWGKTLSEQERPTMPAGTLSR